MGYWHAARLSFTTQDGSRKHKVQFWLYNDMESGIHYLQIRIIWKMQDEGQIIVRIIHL